MPRLQILYSFPDEVGKPGIGTTAFHQVAGAIAQGVDVTLYCTSLRRPLPGLRRLVETMRAGGASVPHRALAIEGAYRYHDLRVAGALRRSGGRYDIVHCWPRACLSTARAARRLGLPVVREVPNTHTGHAFQRVAEESAAVGVELPAGHSHAANSRRLAREEAEYASADYLLVPSEFSRRTFLERGIDAGRLVLHRYGYDPGHFSADSDFGGRLAEEPFTAVFAGGCEPRKGLHVALRAWVESGAAEHGRFVVCGEFMAGYREALAPLLAHPSVELRGFVGDVAAVMKRSHVLILPSVEEGSALVTYEARACGCVLVVSDAAGARCEHGHDALVHPAGDVGRVTEHLRTLVADPDAVARMRANSLAGVVELSWSSAGAELARLYARCAQHVVREGVPPGTDAGASA